MTLEEMKLAVCEKLTEQIHVHGIYAWDGKKRPYWRLAGALVNWPTEGLAVCHEAEKLIEDMVHYSITLSRIVGIGYGPDLSICDDVRSYLCATWEQRLEALCRTWFPERFES